MGVLLPAFAAWATASETITYRPAAITDWTAREFTRTTDYRLVSGDGRSAVRALAEGTASALYHEVEVDLETTPVIEWSWRVDTLPRGDAGERTKSGDDFAARLYVVREGTFGRLSAQALNYVHARTEATGARWTNPYSERASMIAVSSGSDTTGEWMTHRRDLRADWRAAFGEDIERIDAVAIMTDADNTDSRARSLYGTIRFLPADAE